LKLDIEANYLNGVNSKEFLKNVQNLEKLTIFDKNGQKFYNGIDEP